MDFLLHRSLIAVRYPPPFSINAFGAVDAYYADGTVHRRYLDDGTMGADHVKRTIEYYTNGTSVGRLLYTNYFFPGRQAEQDAFQFFPSWLQQDISDDLYPVRVTEFGWYPDAFDSSGCNANLDTTTTPC